MPCPRQAKFIGKLMAFIWLFSLAVSVANACVVPALPDHAAGSPSQQWAPQVAGQAPASGVAAVHDSQERDSCAQACKSFCDSERTTVAKTKSPSIPDLSDTASSVGDARGSQMAAAAHAAATWQLAAAPPRKLTLAIQYLRLTL
jgi:hypothetical protein